MNKLSFFIGCLLTVLCSITAFGQTVALNDIDTTLEDSNVIIDVQANDMGNLSCPVFFTLIHTTPSNGSIMVVNSDSIRYTPNPNFYGSDTFEYIICDCIFPTPSCDTATVYVTVLQVNDPPTAVDDIDTTNEDESIVIDVLLNDSDVEGGAIGTIPGGDGPYHGIAIVLGSDSVLYIPNANFFGCDSFKYAACDDGLGGVSLCDTAWVKVYILPVEDAPEFLNDSIKITTVEDSLVGINLGSITINVDDDTISYSLLSVASDGMVSILGDSLVYTPNPDFYGDDQFAITACDPLANCDTLYVTVCVLPVNDAPSANGDSLTVLEDSNGVVNVVLNDTDIDDDVLTVTIITPPNNGSASVTDSSISYTPDSNFNGVDSIVFVVCDSSLACDTSVLYISVTPVNDAPVGVDDTVSVLEDSSITIDVLDNDYDVDGDSLFITVIDSGDNGIITIVDGVITYTPDSNFVGSDTITYVVCDTSSPMQCDTASIFITTTPVNDMPFAVKDSAGTTEDVWIVIDVQANDYDTETGVLTTSIVTMPSNGSVTVLALDSIIYTPNSNFSGIDTFWYSICDGGSPILCDTTFVCVTVTDENDAPLAVDDTVDADEATVVIIDVQNNDSDIDGDVFYTFILTPPSHGIATVINGDSISYTPLGDFFGADTIVYVVCDSAMPPLCDTAVIYITVTNVNDAPIAQNDAAITNEDTPITIDVQVNDHDTEMDTLTTVIISGPNNGTATVLNGDSIIYTPDSNYYGNDTIYYYICDNGVPPFCDTAVVYIIVLPINDAPIANDDMGLGTGGDITVDILDNDINVDGDSTYVVIIDSGDNGTVIINPDGSITYTPDSGFFGFDTIVYILCDSSLCDTAMVYITISNNQAPIAVDDIDSTSMGDQVLINVLVNDSDPNNDSLAVFILTMPDKGNVILAPNGVVIYTPYEDETGVDSFIYYICDGGFPTLYDTATVYITISELDNFGIDVSNSVSPNDDNMNDFFIIEGLYRYNDYQLTLFNRWGDILLKTKNYQNNWNGVPSGSWRSTNEAVPEGVYFYILEIEDIQETLSGYFLIRK